MIAAGARRLMLIRSANSEAMPRISICCLGHTFGRFGMLLAIHLGKEFVKHEIMQEHCTIDKVVTGIVTYIVYQDESTILQKSDADVYALDRRIEAKVYLDDKHSWTRRVVSRSGVGASWRRTRACYPHTR